MKAHERDRETKSAGQGCELFNKWCWGYSLSIWGKNEIRLPMFQ